MSGAMLNTINVSAQVTSLLWSTSHREIAATLGYANPDHPVRIAVYSWPECQQVVQVPWQEDMRALYAVAYPGGPSTSEGTLLRAEQDDGEALTEADRLLEELRGKTNRSNNLKQSEGCIVVAASDETVRFHEVWSETTKGVLQWKGVLGGSDILEELEGIDREGREMIR
jgi:meiosis-specific APC/C activator protein AMA1